MSKLWDMKEQLAIGRKGEKLFEASWPHPIRRHHLLKGPDYVDSTGAIIEVKSDQYDMTKTENCFWERYSSFEAKSPGSVWQALSKGCDTFVYMFINPKPVIFVFRDLPALVERLDTLTQNMYGHSIRNKGWTTVGYKVKRSLLADLYEEVELVPKMRPKKTKPGIPK